MDVHASQLLTQRQAAEYLVVSPRTLENWRTRGGGPSFIRVGSLVRYRREELDAWLSEHTYGSTTEADHAA